MSNNVIPFYRVCDVETLNREYLRICDLPDGPTKEKLRREWLAAAKPRVMDELRKALEVEQ